MERMGFDFFLEIKDRSFSPHYSLFIETSGSFRFRSRVHYRKTKVMMSRIGKRIPML